MSGRQYEYATDINGEVLIPGDYVSAKAWKRTIRGHIAISERAMCVVGGENGYTAPALIIKVQNESGVTEYSLPGPRFVRKLKKQSPAMKAVEAVAKENSELLSRLAKK